MRDAIIERSISELQKQGLRFSIDEVAKSLKISKKTIYKYFPAKEDLAIAIYKTFYENAVNQIRSIDIDIEHTSKGVVTQILTVYYRSHCMVRKDIFNKYSLNDGIRFLAQNNHDIIKTYIEKKLPQENREALMVIIDGSLQRLCEIGENEKKVIALLRELLC